MSRETWITRDSDGWAFWSAKPRPDRRGRFTAGPGEQPANVKLLNEFGEFAITCDIKEGETAMVDQEMPIAIGEDGSFVVQVYVSTIEEFGQ